MDRSGEWWRPAGRLQPGSLIRRYPFTLCYLLILVCTGVVTMVWLSRPDAESLLRGVSTNLDNLAHRPLLALVGSGLVVDNDGDLFSALFFVGLGLLIGLPLLERRCGGWRTLGVFAAGHIGGTALVAAVELYGLHRGLLPDSIRTDFDYGISYGAMAVLGALACRLPGWWPLLPVGALLAWPFLGTDFTPLPDLGALGHSSAALFGVACGLALFTRSRRQAAVSVGTMTTVSSVGETPKVG